MYLYGRLETVISKDELSPDEARELLNALLDGDPQQLATLRTLLANPYATGYLHEDFKGTLGRIKKEMHAAGSIPAIKITPSSPIEDLALPTRITNRLGNAGYSTVGQLDAASDTNLLEVHLLAESSVRIIRAALRAAQRSDKGEAITISD